MLSIRSLLTTSAAFVCLTGTAVAADFSPRPPVIEQTAVAPEEIGSGWYLRGDIGFARQIPPKITWNGTTETSVKASDTLDAGFGAGYKFNDWMRADVTLDYLSVRNFSGSVDATTRDSYKADSLVLLANAYADLGTWGGLTPYLGAGVGVAEQRVGGVTRTAAAATYSFASANTFSLAADAAAGITYDLGHGMSTDLGYRLLWIDRSRSGGETTGKIAGNINASDSVSHQFRVGLRYYMN